MAAFLKLPATSLAKTLVLVADGKGVVAILRGDHNLSETKFQTATGCQEFRPAHPEEIRNWFGADAGSLGPVGVKNLRVLVDEALKGRKNLVVGANKDDFHLKNVTPERDFTGEWHDLRQVADGDTDLETGAPLEVLKTVEIGHIFKLGYKYSHSMGLNVLNSEGVETPVIMGSYGIGIERILCAAIELYSDANGISMPVSIAPFEVVVTPVKASDEKLRQAAETIYQELKAQGVDVVARRPRREPRRQVQGRRPDRRALSRDGWQEAGARRGGNRRAPDEADDGSPGRRSRGVGGEAGAGGQAVPEIVMSRDWERIREEFPSLKRFTYLNTATFGQTPQCAVRAMAEHLAHRDESACADFLDWFTDHDRLRGKLAQLINCTADEIAFMPNASAGLALLMNGSEWEPGDEVVTLTGEFPNQIYAPAARGVKLVETEWADFERSLSKRTRLVALSTVNYTNGFRPPLEKVAQAARAAGALLYIDGTQSVGALRFDWQAIQPDLLAVNTYKWMLTPNGLAFLAVHPRLRRATGAAGGRLAQPSRLAQRESPAPRPAGVQGIGREDTRAECCPRCSATRWKRWWI